jgi:hypothetical protein
MSAPSASFFTALVDESLVGTFVVEEGRIVYANRFEPDQLHQNLFFFFSSLRFVTSFGANCSPVRLLRVILFTRKVAAPNFVPFDVCAGCAASSLPSRS